MNDGTGLWIVFLIAEETRFYLLLQNVHKQTAVAKGRCQEMVKV